MAPTTELEMLDGLDSEGKGLYKQWKYAATQQADILTAYCNIDSTATAFAAMDLAIKEITHRLGCERDK